MPKNKKFDDVNYNLNSINSKKTNLKCKLLKKLRKQNRLLRQIKDFKGVEKKEGDKQDEINSNFDKEEPLLLSTVSIAIPGSILKNAQSPQLQTYLVGQIARAACIFRVDEIIVYEDEFIQNKSFDKKISQSCEKMAKILRYLECPQYLRKFFFPINEDLKFSGLLNPLDAPHHLRQENSFFYREGIITDKVVKAGQGSYVNVGLLNDVLVPEKVSPGIRVTVKINNYNYKQKKLKGNVVSPLEPRKKTGVYWGYSVRIANSLSNVFNECPYENGYDVKIGTSDKGSPINNENECVTYDHLLIVFGGLKGIEKAFENDSYYVTNNKIENIFDKYLNVLPSQGSRTIRTEEALLITLSILQERLNPKVKDLKLDFKDLLPQSENTGKKQYIQVNAKFHTQADDLSRFD